MASTQEQKNKKPRKTVQSYSKEDLQTALNDIREKGRGIRETCRTYGIPRTTIQDRLSGKRCDVIKQKGPDPVLGIEGEKRVKEWLITIAKCGFPIKKQELLDTVQKIIKDHGTKNPFKDDRPGQTWYINFLKRHPDISLRSAESINKARARVTEESVRIWFHELKNFLKENNNEDILNCPERIFNGDESGFSLCPKTGKVLAPRGFRNLYQVKAGNEKENLTVLVTFNANGQICPPLVVFPYKRPPRAVVESMPEDWCLGKSESGWMRSDVFYEYITNDFNNWVDCNFIQKPILLLVDGHRSHMSLGLSAMCEKLGIILYALPPNTTHMLQPADVSVFGPLKSSWQKVVRKFLSKPENVNSSVNKTNFCRLFRDTLEDTSMEVNIKNGFRKCGLFPFNPDAVDFTKCVQNTLENVNKGPTSKSQEITNEDLVSARKVLKHLKPTLKEKKINVSIILKELRKLKTRTVNYDTDSEIITDSSANYSSSFQMEYSTHGLSVSNPSLLCPNITTDDMPSTVAANLVNEVQTSGTETTAEFRPEIAEVIHVTAEIHPIPQTITRERSYPEMAVVRHNPDDQILPHSLDEIIDINQTGKSCRTLSTPNFTELTVVTDDQTNYYNDKIISPSVTLKDGLDDILPCPAGETTISMDTSHSKLGNVDELSTLHLTGTGMSSFLEIGSLVSLDDVIVTQALEVSESDAFARHLFIPEPPQRAQPKQVKTPAAISSGAWRKFYNDKENLKADKLKRKQERIIKTKQKKVKRDLKPETRTRRDKNKKDTTLKEMCTECGDILISDCEDDEDKNLGCDFCQRWYHLKCTIFVGSPYIDVKDKSFKCKACLTD